MPEFHKAADGIRGEVRVDTAVRSTVEADGSSTRFTADAIGGFMFRSSRRTILRSLTRTGFEVSTAMAELKIIQYPHPTLRRVSKPLKRVDAELRGMIARMFELMYEAKGVGLAANQVDLPYRFFVANLKSDPKAGEELVFINPVLSRQKGTAEAEEGCLSLPGLYADVRRSERVTIDAYNLAGESVHLEADDLLARVVQHETDHLDGKLFIDRLNPSAQLEVRDVVHEFEIQFDSQRQRGEMPSDEQIERRWEELEKLRT